MPADPRARPSFWERAPRAGEGAASANAQTIPAAPAGAPLRSTDFYAAQKENRRNTIWLIAVVLAIGAVLGYLIGLLFDVAGSDPATVNLLAVSGAGLIGAAVLSGIGLAASGVALLSGDKVIVKLTGAREVSRDQEPVLHNVVEEMAVASGLPKPRVVVIETDALNAFATGMRPDRAALGVTRGLLNTLSRDELQGVVGHEMGHIANLDTRYMTAVGILVGLIALVCDGVRRSLRGFRFRSSGGSGRGRGSAVLVLLIILVLFSILAPLAANLVRLAVSRQREYLADATSVQFTRNPGGLIGALEKLGAAAAPFDGANRATQHMFIINPFRHATDSESALTATHPSLESRIARLRNLGAG